MTKMKTNHHTMLAKKISRQGGRPKTYYDKVGKYGRLDKQSMGGGKGGIRTLTADERCDAVLGEGRNLWNFGRDPIPGTDADEDDGLGKPSVFPPRSAASSAAPKMPPLRSAQ